MGIIPTETESAAGRAETWGSREKGDFGDTGTTTSGSLGGQDGWCGVLAGAPQVVHACAPRPGSAHSEAPRRGRVRPVYPACPCTRGKPRPPALSPR